MRWLFAASTVFLFANASLAADKLVIISPHRKSLQDEYIPVFKEHYRKQYKTDIEVEWIDQGGTSDDIRFLKAKFEKNPKTSDIDIMWGGGASAHMELDRDGLLQPYKLSKEAAAALPATAAGVPLRSKKDTWFGVAMSSFGIFYNKKAAKLEGVAAPATWSDLGDPRFNDQVSLADPRHSGSNSTMNVIVVKSLGWDKGMEQLTRIAANVRKFEQSSSNPIKAVVSGDVLAAMAIDFYAYAKVAEVGRDNLGFVLPAGQTMLDPDPVSMLKGAPRAKEAGRFIEFLLTPAAQKLLMLPKGHPEGPKTETLARMAVLPSVYGPTKGARVVEQNPFEAKSFLNLDNDALARMARPLNDLIGATLVDTQTDLKAAWAAVIKRGMKPADLTRLGQPPVSEKELLAMADKWDDDMFRNKQINSWVEFARAKYRALAK